MVMLDLYVLTKVMKHPMSANWLHNGKVVQIFVEECLIGEIYYAEEN
jgi:hypothetical protein